MTEPRPTPEGALTETEKLTAQEALGEIRNVCIVTGTVLLVSEVARFERRERIEWGDEEVGERWVECGSISTRPATQAEIAAVRVAPEGREPPPEIAKMLTAYGNASFDCGAWTDEDGEPYGDVHARASAARAKLEAVLNRVAPEAR